MKSEISEFKSSVKYYLKSDLSEGMKREEIKLLRWQFMTMHSDALDTKLPRAARKKLSRSWTAMIKKLKQKRTSRAND